MTVTKGQLEYEMNHLLKKLKLRDVNRFKQLQHLKIVEPVSFFKVKDGAVEDWEILASKE